MKEQDCVTVTTENVLDAIKGWRGEIKDAEGVSVFTTTDIAASMGCDEYRVRVACSWLRRYQVIEAIQGTACMRRTRRTGERYSACLYRLKPVAEPADVNALYQVFGLGVK